MTFPPEHFYNEPAECAALQAGVLAGCDAPAFKSFNLIGDEARPQQVHLYAAARPEYNDRPIAVYERQGGDLVLLTIEAPTKKR